MTDGAAEVDPRRRRHHAARRGARQGRPRRAGAEDARGGLEDALGGGKRRRGKEDLRGGLHDARRSNAGDDGQAGLGPAGRRGRPLGKVREGRLWSEGPRWLGIAEPTLSAQESEDHPFNPTGSCVQSAAL